MPKGKGRGYNDLTENDKKQIIKLYYSGLNFEEIKTIFPLTQRALPQVLKENNINTKRKNKYTLNENYFEKIDDEHKAYWLGFIAADGCITKTNYFAISLKDKEILELLKNDLNYSGEVYSPKSKQGTYYRINFSSEKMCNDLRKLGILENKSLIYNDLPNIDDNLIRHFLRGYFDGDGMIGCYKRTNYNSEKTVYSDSWVMKIIATKSFCNNLLSLINNNLKFKGTITQASNCDSMYYFSVYKTSSLASFYVYMYYNCSIYLNRKHDIWLKFWGSLEK